MNTKQVIVVRKDLNMRKGKIAAQASHAAMSFITKGLKPTSKHPECGMPYYANPFVLTVDNFSEVMNWLENSFRKICVSVNSEAELREIYDKARAAKLMAHLIEDNGATEFNGVKTLTCCAIGPHYDYAFAGLTDHLPLL
jgi:PTH2 family peptidyl-tRNA hydrolase